MRTGIDRNTGAALTGWGHCVQSILDIVSTAIGSRVIARAYGSNAPNLIDRPQSPPSIVAHFSAIAEALRKWEPGFALKQVTPTRLGPEGVAGFALAGDYYPNGYRGDYSIVVPMQTVNVPLPAIF
ncbi:MAG: baseplate assembly protein [Roseiarcus sp.]